MQPSLVGLLICGMILAISLPSRGPVFVALLASLAFGSTAAVTLPALGGSSPLIYTLFAALLVMYVTVRQGFWKELGRAFGSIRVLWLLTGLMFYAVVGAFFLPRLFAGKTAVFAQSQTQRGAVMETSLAPVSGNISQTGYFVLGGLVAIALCVLLGKQGRLVQVRQGFFLWCFLAAAMGTVDLAAKLAGMPDVLAPIRTASYAMLTQVNEAGFWRIAGAYSEASAFGAASLASLAFTYTYWRKTKSRFALGLSATLLALIILSTSSTAYTGLIILAMFVALSIAFSASSKRAIRNDELLIVSTMIIGVFSIFCIAIFDEGVLDPIVRLIDRTILNKASTYSAQERMYWNMKSIHALADTGGLGIGFGSSRASSWLVAVVSQLGPLGALLMGSLLLFVVRGMAGLKEWIDPQTDAIVSSVRASAIAGIVAASLSSGSADPGMVFFIAVAVVAVARVYARRNRDAAEHAQRAPGGGAFIPAWAAA